MCSRESSPMYELTPQLSTKMSWHGKVRIQVSDWAVTIQPPELSPATSCTLHLWEAEAKRSGDQAQVPRRDTDLSTTGSCLSWPPLSVLVVDASFRNWNTIITDLSFLLQVPISIVWVLFLGYIIQFLKKLHKEGPVTCTYNSVDWVWRLSGQCPQKENL